MLRQIIMVIKGIRNIMRAKPSTFHENYFNNLKTEPSEYYAKKLSSIKANKLIGEFLQSNRPFLVTRLGSGEIRCVSNYWHNEKYKEKGWHHPIKHEMFNYGGLFPQTKKMLKKFAIEYSSHFSHIDILGIWYNRGEEVVCNEFAPNAKLVDLVDLEPYYHQNPWSKYLAGKKVLLIHPFDKSIRKQYDKRIHLFKDKQVLPEFELSTFKTVQSYPGHSLRYKNWMEALSWMEKEISKKDFNVAIIGAGPYGLPLASHVKKIGKQAIHMGGATQLLFGIKGGRWDNIPFTKKLYNNHWVRPLPEETPKSASVIEKKAYW